MSKKIVVICGPTASGKTALSIALAKAFDGEVVSADSMQIYRRMDIGTAKPSLAEREGVTLSMECHKNTFTEHPGDALALMEAVGSPRFRMYWQPFQWQEEAEHLAYARALAPYVTHLHVFHWRGTGRYPLAEAVPAWRSYLDAVGGERTLLLEFMPDDALATLPTEAEALRRIAE